MQYRFVYDVLNDGPPWLGVAFAVVPLLLAVACVLEILQRVRGRRPPSPGRRASPLEVAPLALEIVSVLLLVSAGVFFASRTYEGFVQQQRCQEWVRSGQYQVTEGTVADYEYRKAGPRFRVADSSFDLLDHSAGFAGRFNIPGAAAESLQEGMRVRLAHREGFVLRVEVAAEPVAVPGRVGSR